MQADGAEYESVLYLLLRLIAVCVTTARRRCVECACRVQESKLDGMVRWVESGPKRELGLAPMSDAARTFAPMAKVTTELLHISPPHPPFFHSDAAHASRVLFAATETLSLLPAAACPHPGAFHTFINGAR